MIGIVVVGHGRLSAEMVRTVESVLGPTEGLEAVPTEVDEGPEAIHDRIAGAVARVDRGRGVIILTDMLGDTPTNQSLRIARERGCEVIAGVNMPILFKLVSARNERAIGSARALADFIRRYGQEHIFWATGPDADGQAEVPRRRNGGSGRR